VIRDTKLSSADESEMYNSFAGDLQAYFKLLLDEVDKSIGENENLHLDQIINEVGKVFDRKVKE